MAIKVGGFIQKNGLCRIVAKQFGEFWHFVSVFTVWGFALTHISPRTK